MWMSWVQSDVKGWFCDVGKLDDWGNCGSSFVGGYVEREIVRKIEPYKNKLFVKSVKIIFPRRTLGKVFEL